MDIPSSSSSTGPAKPVANSNSKQLKEILEDYFREVNQCPTPMERRALLEKIKAVPGCEEYSLARLTNWFANRRQRLRMKELKARALYPNGDSDPRFPSLTPAAIQHLTVLASNQLDPSSELLKTWVVLLASSGATEQDVTNWIHSRNQEQQFQHLPTPSDTTMTPEPSATSQSPTYKQETTTPVMPALQLRSYEHAPSKPSPLLPTSDSDLNQHLQVPLTGLQAIIQGVCDALASPQTISNTAPRTAAEFEAMFSPFEQKILHLLHALES